ncbi:MAG: head-tail connector protein [Candidatus Onthovivens sp.]|nr:head-tail connector protein [Candidatus Onthovivens sp.]
MKVSDITAKEIANYLRITEMDVSLEEELETYLNVAIKYIKDETGLDDLDKNEDFVIAIYVLCQDMYDNRTFYVDKSNTNRVVETILGRHRVNFL